MAGFSGAEDAGVYLLRDDCALIQTVDFFPPIVDDPFDFGRIAAANSLSDIYAMGGQPISALNIVAFPLRCLGADILKEILRGGLATLQEANVPLIGGHSIEDEEIKYGLSIVGTAHPKEIIRNNTPQQGDSLLLTKPIGTGIIATAIKAEMVDPSHLQAMIDSMSFLNNLANQCMKNFKVHACTDVTGFGLLGHLKEMVAGTFCDVTILCKKIPLLDGAVEYTKMGLIPGGAYRNKEYIKKTVIGLKTLDSSLQDILVDPQTSGGLLICLPPEEAQELIKVLSQLQKLPIAIIGEFFPGKGKIHLTP